MSDKTVDEAQALNKELQVSIMKQIRAFEKATGLRITAAKMIDYQNTRFFTTTVFMPPKHMKKDNAG